ncbi:sugar-binding transcriptional regulator [Roseibium sediminis]|uniref:sugar-binding transcriptional regulator n=1 Tax=Roseibium sediminis TaxID=1775174 RepID=UPI00186434AB|nr:sugar-binding transcriptional regulator [Roseibium sediminis]
MRAQEDDWTTYLAIRAAWLSFVGGRTQGEIASQLGVSPAKVHRLIAHAQKTGLVKFQIEGRPLECLELEESIAGEFGLNRCIVTPDLGSSDQETAIRAIAGTAAQMLTGLLTSENVRRVGVGMGRTLKAAVEALPKISRPDLEIISISGSLTRSLAANPYDVVQQMQERVGGVGYYLPVPYFAESPAEKAVFLGQSSVQGLLDRARGSDLFVVGIGSMENEGHLVERGIITKEEQSALISTGAASDLMGRFLDVDGREARGTLGDCAVGLHYEDVRGARILALAGGESKAVATLAALRTGVITDLIADETLARAVCKKAGLQTQCSSSLHGTA